MRLGKIVTRGGDDGTTGLGDGSRVAKDCARIEAMGTVDELNSALGLVLAESLPAPLRELLVVVQHEIFDLGGELAIPGRGGVSDAHVAALERAQEALNATLPPLAEFVLPGGCRAAAACHVARCVCRRAERRLVSLAQVEQVSSAALKYLNRLSDLLFDMAREINRAEDVAETLWSRAAEHR